MAKYTAEYSCGHSGEVQLYGPHKERERKLEWYKDRASCPACYRASKDAEGPSVVVRRSISPCRPA